MKKFVAMLKDTRATIEKAMSQGKTLEQMKQDKILEPWSKWSGDFINTDGFTKTLYEDLSGKKNNDFMKHN